jgi:hypothetical protein
MFLVGLMTWWYGDGWRQRVSMMHRRLADSSDYFSFGILAKTLFAPYRQISAGGTSGPIGAQARAFLDRSISRIIGAFIRSAVLISGIVFMFVQVIFGGFVLASWILSPLLPVLGLIMTVIGWVPTW